MKKVTLILALFLGFIPMLNAQWTSPGNGTTYNIDDLIASCGMKATNSIESKTTSPFRPTTNLMSTIPCTLATMSP